ncbi:unnamed protein product [Rhizoctonia solani]|uniref:Uncharacterized protein n=1 Tax=Rhizoctonia solani TaxID=456999 RepID=A0A8H3GZP0_9AGAM|nr:unnamed protein product [Rhizoctonia solani]
MKWSHGVRVILFDWLALRIKTPSSSWPVFAIHFLLDPAMAIPFIPSSRPISPNPSRTFVGTSGDDIDEMTITENDGEKRVADQGRNKQEHQLSAKTNITPDTEELKTEGAIPDEDEFPDGGLRAWLVVLGGAFVTFST